MSFKPIDPKRDEFRRYLERNGVIESLTKVFVRIVKERPENPLDYLRHNLGDSLQEADTLAYLQGELNEARTEAKRLRGIIQKINPQILEEIDNERNNQQQQGKAQHDQDKEQTLNVANGNEVEGSVVTSATTTPAGVVTDNAVIEEAAIETSDTQIAEGQQEKIIEQAINDCQKVATNETEQQPSNNKVAQNNVSNIDNNIE